MNTENHDGPRVYVLERCSLVLPSVWDLVSVHWDQKPAQERIPRLVEIENSLRVPCGMPPITPDMFRVRVMPVLT
jgi:hypothetical protein